MGVVGARWSLFSHLRAAGMLKLTSILRTKILTLADYAGRSENMEFVDFFYVTPCKTQKRKVSPKILF